MGLVLAFTSFAQVAIGADRYGHRFNKEGFIQNGKGKKCWYSQSYQETNLHFMPSNMRHTTHQDVRTIEFRDPGCMSDGGNDVFRFLNKRAIRRTVAGWFLGTYIRKDARYDIDKARRPKMEAKGECIQSKQYPTRGIVMDYLVENGSIVKAVYMPATFGCH